MADLDPQTPVWTGLPVDLLALHEANPARYPFLLESTTAGESRINRYSLLLGFPEQTLTLTEEGLFDGTQRLDETDFLRRLDREWHQQRISRERLDSEQPFNGGWFIYLGYELAAQIEPSLQLPSAGSGLPIALAARCPAAIVIDHHRRQTSLIVEPDQAGAEAMLAAMRQDMASAGANTAPVPAPRLGVSHEDPPEAFLHNVARIHDYLMAGDVFQVNLSRQWQIECREKVSPAQLYRNLRHANPAPFAGLFSWHNHAVISSSPERLIQVQGDVVQTRPIAGTRRREAASRTELDSSELSGLIGHPKERAEHIMLIDLERNDLGRVCEPGSVEVDELLGLESYAHVHHIVSNVRGRLRDTASPLDALRAVFPGGTITGCPKVRCMEIIAELEGVGRGPYTGAMGYLDRGGNLDMNILIRSLELQGRQIRFRAGAGIVADSDAQAELAETRAKAAGLLSSLGLDDDV